MKHKKLLSYSIKVSLVGILLYFLVKKGFLSLTNTQNAFAHWDKLSIVFIIMMINTCLGFIRWQWLLRAQNIVIPWKRVIQLAFIGHFFNVALPGAVSGDLIKAFYIGKEIDGQRGRAFGAILFDRILGVSALGLVSAGAIIVGFSTFQGSILLSALRVMISCAAFATLAFYTYLFLVREQHDPLLIFFKKLELRFKRASSLTRIYEGVRHYHHHKKVVLKCLILSLYVHVSIAYASLLLVQALGDYSTPLIALMVVVPLGLLVTAVPIAPAGIGTGHAAYLYLFQLMGSPQGADVYTLFALFSLFIGGIGGLVYLRFRAKEPIREELLAQ